MKLTIDREADALYLDLDESLSYESQEIAPGVILDYSKDGKDARKNKYCFLI